MARTHTTHAWGRTRDVILTRTDFKHRCQHDASRRPCVGRVTVGRGMPNTEAACGSRGGPGGRGGRGGRGGDGRGGRGGRVSRGGLAAPPRSNGGPPPLINATTQAIKATTQAINATTQEIDAATLAAAPPEEQKRLLGERLFPLIQTVQPHLAGKITGMLLEMDNGELLILLESPDALNTKIMEAVSALQMEGMADTSLPPPRPAAARQPPPQPFSKKPNGKKMQGMCQ